jgi:hypothetical protein
MFPGGDESFLRHVFALAEIAEPAVSERADENLVARDNPAESVAVAGPTARNQFRIGVFLCGQCSIGNHIGQYVPAKAKAVTKFLLTRPE